METLEIKITGNPDKVLKVYNKIYDKEFKNIREIKGYLNDTILTINYFRDKPCTSTITVTHRH